MFTHIMVGTNDLEKAKAFYTPVLGALGIPAPFDTGTALFVQHGGGAFGVTKPANGAPATHANGGTIGFAAQSPEMVDAFHAAGLASGGTDEGAPGVREGAPGKPYGAYLRDPDGNKLCAFTSGNS